MFIAADGDECAYLPDCAERASSIAARAQDLLRAAGFAPQRVKMAAICSVCAEHFTAHMRESSHLLETLEPGKGAA